MRQQDAQGGGTGAAARAANKSIDDALRVPRAQGLTTDRQIPLLRGLMAHRPSCHLTLRSWLSVHQAAARLTTHTHNQAWFSDTAGVLLQHAKGRTGSRACARVRTNLRVRLGAVHTPVNMGRRNRVPFGERLTPRAQRRDGGRASGTRSTRSSNAGWCKISWGSGGAGKAPPGGATDFSQLYNGNLKKAVAYVADVEELLAAAA